MAAIDTSAIAQHDNKNANNLAINQHGNKAANNPVNDTSSENILDTADLNGQDEKGRFGCRKITVALFLLGFIIFVILDYTVGKGWIREAVHSFLRWIEDNPVPGTFAFVTVYFASTIVFIPGAILTLGAGFVFANAFGLVVGILLGTVCAFIGAICGAVVAFLLGRYLLRDWVTSLTKKYIIFGAVNNALAQQGLWIMILLRLSPLMPFNVVNYVAGVTAIRFWEYVWALFAILPGTILYVFLGATAGSLANSENAGKNKAVTYVVVVVGVIFGAIAMAVTSYYARQELHQLTQQGQSNIENTKNKATAEFDDMEEGSVFSV